MTLVTHKKHCELGHEAADFGLRIEDVPRRQFGQDPRRGLRVIHVERAEMNGGAESTAAKWAKVVGDAGGLHPR
ncbi:MAG: hypothetical protein ABSC94_28300 [Polyangiaceae bacterium]